MLRIDQEFNNIPVYLFQTDKFKTINIRLVFKNHFTRENATKYSLLTSILANTSKKYNTKRKASNALDNLYSANISIGTYSIHRTRITYFNLTIINEKYIDEKILKEGIDLLKEYLLFPNLENGKFNQKIFDEEKSLLEVSLKRVFNNKNRYAFKQMIKNMCPNEIVSVSSNGSLEDLEMINNQNIYETYLDLINNSEKEVYIIGDVDYSYITRLLDNKILNKLKQNSLLLDSNLKENKEVKNINTIREKADMSQMQLYLGYRTTIGPQDDLYFALKTFVMMFGGVYSSNLNRVIREEHSFTYSIYAQLIEKAKIMYINAGLDLKNCDKTIELISEELNKYQQGIIDSDLLNATKAEFLDKIESFDDSVGSILDTFIDCNTMLKGYKEFKTIKEYKDFIISSINSITINDLVQAANTITLDTIYRLEPKCEKDNI